MKRVFHFSEIISACLFIALVFSSCNNSSSTGGNSEVSDSAQFQPVPGAILITGIDAAGKLILKDNHGNSANTREAHRTEIINWIVQPHSGVKSISEIAIDTKVIPNDNVFSTLPHQQGDAKHWQGTIADLDPTKAFGEKYYIKWVGDNSTQPQVFDPKIQLNPTFIPPDSSEEKAP
jgi:hypothetical protein